MDIILLSFASRGTVTLPLSSRHQAIELRSPVACWERGPEDDEGRGEKEGRSRDRYARTLTVVMALSLCGPQERIEVALRSLSCITGETTLSWSKLCCCTLFASTLSRTASLESRPRKKKGTPPTTLPSSGRCRNYRRCAEDSSVYEQRSRTFIFEKYCPLTLPTVLVKTPEHGYNSRMHACHQIRGDNDYSSLSPSRWDCSGRTARQHDVDGFGCAPFRHRASRWRGNSRPTPKMNGWSIT
jgi:hypothetical protein